jgi:hypothetical protein
MIQVYELVENAEKLKIYNSIWKNESWKKQGYEITDFEGEAYRYLIFAEKDGEAEYFGTMEAVDYNPDFVNLSKTSNVEDAFRFSELEIIQENWNRIAEIDKLTILQTKTSLKRMKMALTAVANHCEMKEYPVAVALINPQFFHVMKNAFKMDIYSAVDGDSATIVHNGYEVVPTIILIGKMNSEKYKHSRWLLNGAPVMK